MLETRTLTWLFLLILCVGCSPEQSSREVETKPIENSKRPPLKIWLVEVPEIEKEMSVRWQAASDQPIQIINLSATELVKSTNWDGDVILYPGSLMGDLIDSNAISKLPAQALQSRNVKSDERVIAADPGAPKIDPADAWPARWRAISSFAGQRYAIPLGAANLTAVSVNMPTGPLKDLESSLTSTRDMNANAATQWKSLLDPIEQDHPSPLAERTATMEARLATLTPIEKDCLVDRFLWIASTTEARRKGLFDLVEMESRIHKPEFLISARVLGMMARLFPEALFSNHNRAWNRVVSSASSNPMLAIGMPDAVFVDPLENSMASENKPIVSTLTWNPCQGLLVSMGKKTRQTAVSCQFISWLSEPEQREAFRNLCSRVELLPGQSDRNAVRDDYRDYQRANTRELRADGAELSLRLVNANQYRAVLAESLIESIQTPEKTESILRKCTEKWNELTNTLGMDKQRMSQEKSLGYRN